MLVLRSSILARPEGRALQKILKPIVAEIVFQSSLGPKAERYVNLIQQAVVLVEQFQSSLGPKAERYNPIAA